MSLRKHQYFRVGEVKRKCAGDQKQQLPRGRGEARKISGLGSPFRKKRTPASSKASERFMERRMGTFASDLAMQSLLVAEGFGNF